MKKKNEKGAKAKTEDAVSIKNGRMIKTITNIALVLFIAAGITYAIVKEVKAKKAADEAAQLIKEQEATALQAQQAKVQETAVQPKTGKFRVVAYYLHSTGRCSNCFKIETWSKETMDKFFVKEQKSGKLVFKSLNIDEGENRHYIDDYKLTNKSLVLTLQKGGKEQKYEVLSGVWNNLQDQNAFYEYVKGKTLEYLKAAE